jgi:NADH-quinone oxidoreductase subunit F
MLIAARGHRLSQKATSTSQRISPGGQAPGHRHQAGGARYGLLGDNMPERISDFDIKHQPGGGAFVCGESTALMASLEGKVGAPGQICPHRGKGLPGRPHQSEQRGDLRQCPPSSTRARMVCSMGTEHSKGTKVFSLVGKDQQHRPGGSAHGDNAAGDRFRHRRRCPKKKKFKAVQTGGPSGGCIPERFWICRLTSTNWPRSAPSWGPAA